MPRAQQTEVIPPHIATAITAPPAAPVAGAIGADVTIVEFLDYNCPYCKKSAPELQKLLRADRRVRIIYKEWAIFGNISEYAARAVLAAEWQGRSLAAHNALISVPEELESTSEVDSLLKGVGVDLKKLEDDRTRHAAEIETRLKRDAAEARGLGFRGTPGFLVGRQLVSTAVTFPQLVILVSGARTLERQEGQTAPNP